MRHDEMLGLLHRLLAPGMDVSIVWAFYWECAFWLLVLLVAVLLLAKRPQWLTRAEQVFRRVAAHQSASIALVFVTVITLRLALLTFIPEPIPVPHDEFSYLVGADTFSHFRLTNPPHPMWIFFESFHVNMLPTYQSMYPPAQAMAIAIGQVLLHSTWLGVVLSVAVMCAVFCWMLQAYLPPHWALLGGLFAAIRYGTFSYWINSYFGGAVAAIGGALLVGSVLRMRRKPSTLQVVLFVLGLAILANSRPMEGFLFALPMTLGLLWMALCAGVERKLWMRRVVLPGALLLCVVVGWMGYYNLRSTGHVTSMPYMVNQTQYHLSKPFIFQKPYPPGHYNHPEMRAFYIFHELPDVLLAQSRWGIQLIMERKFSAYYVFLVWPLLLLFAPALLLAATDRNLRLPLAATLVMFAGITFQLWPAHGHYAAPAAGAILLMILSALRKLGADTQPPRYQALARAIVLCLFVWMLVPLADRWVNPYAFDLTMGRPETVIPRQMQRATIESRLQRTPGQHLVIVHYHPRDVPSQDWIYNAADIDGSKVVWARDMGAIANQKLLAYYPNRAVWYVDRGSGAIPTPYATYLSLTHPDQQLLPAAQAR